MPLRRRKKIRTEIHPDEILIDASNTGEFDRDQFEGRLERPLTQRSFFFVGVVLCLIFVAFTARAAMMQVVDGARFATMARENQLTRKILFADRGTIVDRNGLPLAYNERTSVEQDFAQRVYVAMQGLAHVIGYAKPPAKDSSGVYYREAFVGVYGAERAFDTELTGINGEELTQTDAHGAVVAQSITQPQEPGGELRLSIDARVTSGLYQAIAARAESSGFKGGAGVVMDVKTGEILALTSYPEFPQNALESGDAAVLQSLNRAPGQPFLNRATSGLYSPGSIVKPVVAAAVLTEGIIDEDKKILSTGSISLPNPYDKTRPSIFRDWKAHGWVDVRDAIAVSSDVYFYEVGGGFQGQPGLGIEKLDKYFQLFGFSQDTGLEGFPEQSGNIPTIAWKAKTFPDDPTWRVGDTYHTAIGQYGMQVTPLQAARAAAALANNGILITPTIMASTTGSRVNIPVSAHALAVVREGMRQGVTSGIAGAVKYDFVHVAAKTGTAQVGVHNEYVNSWMIGFFPYEHPRYAFAIVLERGPSGVLMGAPAVSGEFISWLHTHAPEYLQ